MNPARTFRAFVTVLNKACSGLFWTRKITGRSVATGRVTYAVDAVRIQTNRLRNTPQRLRLKGPIKKALKAEPLYVILYSNGVYLFIYIRLTSGLGANLTAGSLSAGKGGGPEARFYA
ncbi:hypothetical protein EVAR_80015_1 [Eumeta japonica]|uniref:Uncharacterized protein n=1 Tax=Eumeta variegata TaxID=151549 RepID=A0A4C1WM49_EUMVA|nr:hypothetical protein EVAR_80015_1 [Eumeta japonica]